jgi:hypothetical protein
MSVIHRTWRITSEISKGKQQKVLNVNNVFQTPRGTDKAFLISLDHLPKSYSALCLVKSLLLSKQYKRVRVKQLSMLKVAKEILLRIGVSIRKLFLYPQEPQNRKY